MAHSLPILAYWFKSNYFTLYESSCLPPLPKTAVSQDKTTIYEHALHVLILFNTRMNLTCTELVYSAIG